MTMVVPPTHRTRATGSAVRSKADTGAGRVMHPPPPHPHCPTELSPHAYRRPSAATAAECRAPAATAVAGGSCNGSRGFWKPWRRAEPGPAAAAQPRQYAVLYPHVQTAPAVVRRIAWACPKATSRTPSPHSVAPCRLIHDEWSEDGALAGWCSPHVHSRPDASTTPEQRAPHDGTTQRVAASRRTTAGRLRGSSSPVPSWPEPLLPQESARPSRVTSRACSAPRATACT
mmetsp:Transcript_16657/g.52942  ORF Transcript_16657/g.52942 Transcript_16657/m.52942 type:complete len:230 (-) Transcript_16657:159-848(-)